MRRSATSSIVMLSLLMFTTFAVIIGTSLVGQAQRVKSTNELCSMNIYAYVKEITDSEEEVVLNFSNHPELFESLWGLYDKRRSSSSPIAFNQGSSAEYQVFTTERAFLPFPQDHEIYNPAEKASVSLAYEHGAYDIVRKEIKVCNKGNSTEWLCTDTKQDTNSDALNFETIENLNMDCDMNLEFGWVVKAKASSEESLTASKPVNKAADINRDFAYNTLDLLAVINDYGAGGDSLSTDVNGDGLVNALDYTLVVEAIESQ